MKDGLWETEDGGVIDQEYKSALAVDEMFLSDPSWNTDQGV